MNKQLAQELLIETALFYNSGNRSFDLHKGGVTCIYENRKGDRCALGRVLTDECLKDIKKRRRNARFSARQLFQRYESGALIEKWRPIAESQEGLAFFTYLQGLHDDARNWGELGITEVGMGMIKYVTTVLELDFEKVKEAIEKGRKKD